MSTHTSPIRTKAPVGETLQEYRLQRDLTYRQLAGLIGVSVAVAFKAARGGRINERNVYKIKRFLEKVHAAA